MRGFKKYISDEEDVANTIAKLPKKVKDLVKGYKFIFEPHNTLKGDSGHVGMVTNYPEKVIRVAAPANYGRSFVVMHEIGHLFYEKYIRGTPLEKEWSKLAMSVEDRKKDESSEELLAHAFGATFSKYPPKIHSHPEWDAFIKRVCS